jgi:hypothetical protein
VPRPTRREMVSLFNVSISAALAVVFWSCLGFALAQRVLPRTLALPAAPVLGWAVQTAIALPIFLLTGFSKTLVVALALLALAISAYALWTGRTALASRPSVEVPAWAYPLAGLLALVPTLAILPKETTDGIALAGPMFDHAKVAIIDDMARLGLPPGNPFFGAAGDRLAYYYLWYFGAAQFARVLAVSGWEADVAMTWFTAFASLTLMMGLAVWLSRRISAALWVGLFALAASLRFPLWLLIGTEPVNGLLWPATGLGGWLFQASWVPQHVMAAACDVLAILLMVRLACGPSLLTIATFSLVAVAGFESSTWIGGVTFAVAAPVAALVLLARLEPKRRVPFVMICLGGGALAALLAVPFLHDQVAATAQRSGGFPVGIDPYEVLGPWFPEHLRRILDLPAFWLVLLVIEFPAILITGAIALAGPLLSGPETARKRITAALVALVVASVIVTWLLTSRLGDHNDLAWRAVLPAVLVLIVAASVGLTRWMSQRAYGAAFAAIGALILALPGTVDLAVRNAAGHPSGSAAALAHAPALWAAVRAHTATDERVANNPLFLADATPWPVNISWALLANRRSCYAGRELALAYVPLPDARREAINAQFIRVFDGQGSASDAGALAAQHACRVIVITPADGAWTTDPFAANPSFQLVEYEPDRWKIYRAI